jgi:hypothetical protein
MESAYMLINQGMDKENVIYTDHKEIESMPLAAT